MEEGTVIVATSNRAPWDLNRHGLHEVFNLFFPPLAVPDAGWLNVAVLHVKYTLAGQKPERWASPSHMRAQIRATMFIFLMS